MTGELLAAAAAVFLAYLVRGVSGFGSALVAVPLLAHWLPLTLVVPLITALDVVAALLLTGSGQRRGQVAWREVGWLMPGSLLGVILGLYLLVALDRQFLLGALGVIIIGFGLRQLLGINDKRRVSRWWALPAGMAGGGVGALFATGGPPFVIYLGHRLQDKRVLRSTMSAVFLIDGAVRVAGAVLTGLFAQQQMPWYLLAGLPLMAAGLYAGNHIHLGLSQRQVTVVIALLLLASGLSLIWRVWQAG